MSFCRANFCLKINPDSSKYVTGINKVPSIGNLSERVVKNNKQPEEIGPSSIGVTLALVPVVQEKVDTAVAVRAQELEGEEIDAGSK